KVEHVIIGIGLNVHTRALPEDIAEIATSVALERDARSRTGNIERAELLADILERLDHDVPFVAHRGLGLVHGRLEKHDYFKGREVESDTGEVRGTASGIDDQGRLMVRTAEGMLTRISSGEVRIRAV